MTPAQIDLEFAHIALDKKLRDEASGNQVYSDDEYDSYDQETDENDSKLSDFSNVHTAPYTSNEDSWEDVDIDDDY